MIYLLGEPGLYGAKQALNRLPVEDDDSETLIRSIARSAGPESLNAVTKVLSECLSANDARMRYSAAAALAGLGSEDVRRIFEQALANEANMSVKNLMESALRSKIYGTSG